MISFRERLIEQLEYRLKGAERVLKQVYRHDMVILVSELQKEIEIQKAYLAHEA